jgi:hypothetical protein
MSEVKLTIHNVGTSIDCSLTGKADTDGLVVTFDDGTVRNAGLSWKALKQLLQMKFAQQKPAPKPAPVATPANGPTPAVK